jgi:hypothetical protein
MQLCVEGDGLNNIVYRAYSSKPSDAGPGATFFMSQALFRIRVRI